MPPASRDNRAAVLAATVAAAASIAFQVGSKATRDALFLFSFGAQALPVMVMATALFAIAFAFLSARALVAWGPGRVIPAAYAVSGALILVEWGISLWFPRVAAVLVYLHCGCLGGLLISGFWSMVNERFDPRTVKLDLGPISVWGTLGGALGGFIAARVGQTLPATAMLPILAAFHFVAAAAVARLGLGLAAIARRPVPSDSEEPEKMMRHGIHAIAASSYLRGLVTLIVLVTISEGFLDLALKSRTASALVEQGDLLRFFAVFYAVASLATLLLQTLASRFLMQRTGPAQTAALLPAGVTVASAGALAVPGLLSAALARGVESTLSNSLFRSGYEVLFSPVSARDKRAVKPIADVGAARVGDLVAAGVAQVVLMRTMTHAPIILTVLAACVSAGAVWAALRLQPGYVSVLERGLRSRAIDFDFSSVRDGLTHSIMIKTLSPDERSRILPRSGTTSIPQGWADSPYGERIAELRSRDPSRVLRSLRGDPVPAELAGEVISLLARDDAARDAIENLRRAGPPVIEPVITALVNPEEEFVVRRRIPLVLATYRVRRAVEGLAQGLQDRRFEVRYRCGRGLSHLMDLDPALHVQPATAYNAVLREVEAGAGVWEGRRLLDRFDDEPWSPVLDDMIRNRADRSLEHVFTLLALVLPKEPLRIAFRGLHAEDAFLRGTSLEYLESSLPPDIRKSLWPFLEDRRPRRAAPVRPTEEALAQLLQSSASIAIHLRDLEGKTDRGDE